MKMKTNNKLRTMEAATLYTREYGTTAYQAWLRREADISVLSKCQDYSACEICRMRADSFRQMKAEGSRRPAARPLRRAFSAITAWCSACR